MNLQIRTSGLQFSLKKIKSTVYTFYWWCIWKLNQVGHPSQQCSSFSSPKLSLTLPFSPVRSCACPNPFPFQRWHPYFVIWRSPSPVCSVDPHPALLHHREGPLSLHPSWLSSSLALISGEIHLWRKKIDDTSQYWKFYYIHIHRNSSCTVDCSLPSLLWQQLFPTALQSAWYSKLPSFMVALNTKGGVGENSPKNLSLS